VRRALLAYTHEGNLVFDPFTGSGTTAVAAKELNCAFVGAEPEEEFGQLAVRPILATKRVSLPHEIFEQFWSNA
jgi:site-specific DNA-methyltransferase (adenine-specific)